MVNHDRPDSSKEIVLRFGLLIDKIIKDNTIRFEIKSNNTGIPDAKDGFTSFQPPKDDDK